VGDEGVGRGCRHREEERRRRHGEVVRLGEEEEAGRKRGRLIAGSGFVLDLGFYCIPEGRLHK
jgi:hypothetical protein